MDNTFNDNEDYYKRLREQGVTFWTPDPAEQNRVVGEVKKFLAGYPPEKTSLVEFGCGEGFLAEHILKQGFTYTGIDLSPSAIDYARGRYQDNPKAAFILGNVTCLKDIPDSCFDAGMDILFFHMLVTDEHRRKYLSEVRRVLKPAAGMLLMQAVRPAEVIEEVSGSGDLSGGKEDTNHLPRIPARFNNEAGYRREMQEAGFVIRKSYTRDRWCIMHLKNVRE